MFTIFTYQTSYRTHYDSELTCEAHCASGKSRYINFCRSEKGVGEKKTKWTNYKLTSLAEPGFTPV